jgi:hypothetical protein
VIETGIYDLNGMRVEIDNHQTAKNVVVIDTHPQMQKSLRRYSYRGMEIRAVCWDSAWAALKLFHESNSLSKPERARLVHTHVP